MAHRYLPHGAALAVLFAPSTFGCAASTSSTDPTPEDPKANFSPFHFDSNTPARPDETASSVGAPRGPTAEAPSPDATDPADTDDSAPASGQLDCQIVQAPDSDERLVAQRLPMPAGGIDGEIRLTYRELTALIEEAVRALK